MAEITQTQIDAAIVDSVTNPQSSSIDGTSTTRANIKDIIELDKYMSKKNVRYLGLRYSRVANTGAGL
jgi:hypothetical protein